MPEHTTNCNNCGKTFTRPVYPSSPTPKYCSRKCSQEGRVNKVSLVCQICGASREIKPSWVGRVFTCGDPECTHKLKWRRYSQNIAERIDEPLDSAIQRRYVLERKSYREIAKELDINLRTVMRTLKRLDIEPRGRSEAIATQWENNDNRREEQSERFAQIREDIVGPNHPLWQGGHPYNQDDERWQDIAQSIRKRDNFRCTRCGMTQSECYEAFNKNLSVHHIVPFRLSHDNSPSNLRALCMSCHRKIEYEFLWLL